MSCFFSKSSFLIPIETSEVVYRDENRTVTAKSAVNFMPCIHRKFFQLSIYQRDRHLLFSFVGDVWSDTSVC